MTIQDLGSVGELVVAIVTVVTLVYLALQIRSNTSAVRSAAAQRSTRHLQPGIECSLLMYSLLGLSQKGCGMIRVWRRRIGLALLPHASLSGGKRMLRFRLRPIPVWLKMCNVAATGSHSHFSDRERCAASDDDGRCDLVMRNQLAAYLSLRSG